MMKTNMRQTSLEAFWSIENLGKRETEVLNAIKFLGLACDEDVSNYLKLPINCITGRRNSLVAKGLVVEDRRDLNRRGRQVIIWRAA